MINLQTPEARKEGLVIQELPEELVVYDLKTDKAHSLNKTAAFIWKVCDGKNTISDITKVLSEVEKASNCEDLVWLAIDQLNEKDLLKTEIASKFQVNTRRAVIKKIGLAAVVALPVVASLVAPTSVLAVTSCSCIPTNICGTSGCPPICDGGTGVCITPAPLRSIYGTKPNPKAKYGQKPNPKADYGAKPNPVKKDQGSR